MAVISLAIVIYLVSATPARTQITQETPLYKSTIAQINVFF